MHKSMYPFSVSLFSVALFVRRLQIGPRVLQNTIANTGRTLDCPHGTYVCTCVGVYASCTPCSVSFCYLVLPLP